MAQLLGNGARRFVAQLVARDAAQSLDTGQPLALALKIRRHAVALLPSSGKVALVGDLEHGIPVDGRIVLRRRGRSWRHDGFQVNDLAWRRFYLRRIHKPIAAHP